MKNKILNEIRHLFRTHESYIDHGLLNGRILQCYFHCRSIQSWIKQCSPPAMEWLYQNIDKWRKRKNDLNQWFYLIWGEKKSSLLILLAEVKESLTVKLLPDDGFNISINYFDKKTLCEITFDRINCNVNLWFFWLLKFQDLPSHLHV